MDVLLEMEVLSAACDSIAAIGGGKFLATSSNGLRLITYDNGSVVVGDSEAITGATGTYALTYLSSIDKCVVVYSNASSAKLAAVVTVSGSAISIGTGTEIVGLGSVGTIDVATNGTNHVVVAIGGGSYPNEAGEVVLGTVSGDTISFGTVLGSLEYTSGLVKVVYNSVLSLYVMAVVNKTDSDAFICSVITVSGTDLVQASTRNIVDPLFGLSSNDKEIIALHYSETFDKYILLVNANSYKDLALTMQSSGTTLTDNSAVNLGRLDDGADICYSALTDEMIHSYSLEASELALYGGITINGTVPEVVGADTSLGSPTQYKYPRSDWHPTDTVGAVIYTNPSNSDTAITIYGDSSISVPFWTSHMGQQEIL